MATFMSARMAGICALASALICIAAFSQNGKSGPYSGQPGSLEPAFDVTRDEKASVSGPPIEALVFPTTSFDTRSTAYPELETAEPGLLISEYFDDFFPFECAGRKAGATGGEDGKWDTFQKRYANSYSMSEASGQILGNTIETACKRQTAVVCDKPLPDDDGKNYRTRGAAIYVQNGVLLEVQLPSQSTLCGVVTTIHGWKDFTEVKPHRNGLWCAAPPGPAQELLKTLEQLSAQEGTSVNISDLYFKRRAVREKVPYLYAERFSDDLIYHQNLDQERINSFLLKPFDGSRDLNFERVEPNICLRLRSESEWEIKLQPPTLQDISALTSVASLKLMCDRGVAICSNPPQTNQKRCSYYSPDELGSEGDVYDFRSLVGGRGSITHYGTSFAGHSGSGHYCLRRGKAPIPFGMTVASRLKALDDLDSAARRARLETYIHQGSREQNDDILVVHLANLTDVLQKSEIVASTEEHKVFKD